jgi:hypothetical protein
LDIYAVSQIPVAFTAVTPVFGRTAGSTASGGWENYHVVEEHMHHKFVLNNFIKVVNFFLKLFLVGQGL